MNKVETIIGGKAKVYARKFAKEMNLSPQGEENLRISLRLAFGKTMAKQNRADKQKNLFGAQAEKESGKP